jgi:hypothetical protein
MSDVQAFMIALSIILAGVAIGVAQQLSPANVNGCIYFATPGTLTDRQSTVLTCDSTGKLRVTTTF